MEELTERERMERARLTTCRCCWSAPVVGFLGLCRECGEAVERLIVTRREQLSSEALRRKAAWRGMHA